MRVVCYALTVFLVGLTFAQDAYLYPQPNHYDLVQIDTGVLDPPHRVLRMEASSGPSIGIHHGQHMADYVDEELALQRAKPVTAAQIPWNITDMASYRRAISLVRGLTPKVLGMSLSGKDKLEYEEHELRYLNEQDVLIVVAAGNLEGDKKNERFYPASYDIECLVSVSTSFKGERFALAAPGQLYVEQRTTTVGGTSSSTAIAEGMALKLRQSHPRENCKQIKERLLRLSSLPEIPQVCTKQSCPVRPPQ